MLSHVYHNRTTGYSARQLIRYYRYAKANERNPDAARMLPPGADRHFDTTYTPSAWLAWFRNCLMVKINRNVPERGRGRKAERRAERVLDSAATCKWCGARTGARHKRFCCASCAHSYNS